MFPFLVQDGHQPVVRPEGLVQEPSFSVRDGCQDGRIGNPVTNPVGREGSGDASVPELMDQHDVEALLGAPNVLESILSLSMNRRKRSTLNVQRSTLNRKSQMGTRQWGRFMERGE